MASQVEICNMALSHLGQGKEIANLDTENSEAAASCRRFYDIAVQATLRDFQWPFATVTVALALIEEDPNDEWAFSYGYPTDCLNAVRILSGFRTDTPDTRVPFKIVQSGGSKIIYTDQEDAELEYTIDETDPSIFPPDFVFALSYRLAHYIAPRVAGADPMNLGAKAMQKYLFELSLARANASNEEQPDFPRESEFTRARD